MLLDHSEFTEKHTTYRSETERSRVAIWKTGRVVDQRAWTNDTYISRKILSARFHRHLRAAAAAALSSARKAKVTRLCLLLLL